MFRNAGRLFGQPQQGPKREKSLPWPNPKTTTPQSKQEAQRERPVVPEEQAPTPRVDPNDHDPRVVPASLFPLGLRYSLLKQEREGATEVDTEEVFRSGDRIRLTIESNDSAYLYLVMRGSSGRWSVLFPSSEIAGGDNHVEPRRRYEIPSPHWFSFDQRTGEEHLFILLSRQPQEDLENLIYSLGAPSKSQPIAGPPDQKTLLAQANPIDDVLIKRLRATAYPRDLVLEKVDDARATEQGEKAVYVVDSTGDDDSRVVADVTLIHK